MYVSSVVLCGDGQRDCALRSPFIMIVHDMKIISLAELNQSVAVTLVEGVLRDGGIAAVPTDTVYGLIADATNDAAIRRMFAIKKRLQEKAFPIFVKDVAAARRYAYISDAKMRFLEKVWPGQVTVVFQHKEKLPPVLTGGLSTLGIRIPDHPFLSQLLGRLDSPLAQTSANISDQPPAKTAAEVAAYFEKEKEQPDFLVDGGAVPGAASTVIDFTGAEPLIARAGPLSKAKLDEFVRQ